MTPKKLNDKELIKKARELISLKDLFPRSIVNTRSHLTKYQAKKIKDAINTVENIGGAYAHELVPMGRGRKKYMAEKGLPPYMRGIFLSGGAKINKKLAYSGGEIKYERGTAPRSRTELDTRLDENILIDSAKKILKKRNNRKTSITANGRVIGSAQGMRTNEVIIKEAVYIFLKYSEMSHKKEIRGNGATAAHPNIWGMGILFESPAKIKKPKKAKNAKKTSKK